MLNRNNQYQLFEVVIVLFLIYLSGNPIFKMVFFKQSVIVFFVITLVYFFLKRSNNVDGFLFNKSEINLFLIVIILLISVLITPLLNGDPNISTYIAIGLQLIGAYLCVLSLSFNKFIKIYVKIMIFLAVSSLIFYYLQILFPNLPYMFPNYEGNYQLYSNAILYNFMLFYDSGTYYLMNRNTGIFWEPGSYQVFLNTALFFFLFLKKRESNYLMPKDLIILLIFVITLITTKSTTGYITLLLILVTNIKFLIVSIKSFYMKRQKWLAGFFVTVITVIIIFLGLNKYDINTLIIDTLGKLTNENYMNGNGYFQRLSLNKLEYLFTEGKLHLFGISYETLYTQYHDSQIWNSILDSLVALGYFFTVIIMIGYIKISNYFKINGVILFIILILGFSTEDLFRSPFYLVISFIGLLGIYRKKK